MNKERKKERKKERRKHKKNIHGKIPAMRENICQLRKY